MLFLAKRSTRLAREAKAAFDLQIEAVRIGTVLAHNKHALAGWQRAHAEQTGRPAQTVEGYTATLGRLGALQAHGKPLGLVN